MVQSGKLHSQFVYAIFSDIERRFLIQWIVRIVVVEDSWRTLTGGSLRWVLMFSTLWFFIFFWLVGFSTFWESFWIFFRYFYRSVRSIVFDWKVLFQELLICIRCFDQCNLVQKLAGFFWMNFCMRITSIVF